MARDKGTGKHVNLVDHGDSLTPRCVKSLRDVYRNLLPPHSRMYSAPYTNVSILSVYDLTENNERSRCLPPAVHLGGRCLHKAYHGQSRQADAEGPQPEDAAEHDVVPRECCDCTFHLCPPFIPCC